MTFLSHVSTVHGNMQCHRFTGNGTLISTLNKSQTVLNNVGFTVRFCLKSTNTVNGYFNPYCLYKFPEILGNT